MKIAVGADHAGFPAKEELKTLIRALGHVPIDKGTNAETSVDYPDYAKAVGEAVRAGEAERGVLVCGTGIGMCIGANKVPGVRAAVVWDEKSTELSRRHNDANVFCAGARLMPVVRIAELLKLWLNTPFEGGRHQKRVDKL
ncbi:MAG TPA: ribose 5-phosphate isomerase B [Planctomycetota bacterium]|nr:ribose 5-phosphate isomerase B [Planctomycetota bacterium]